MSTNRGRTTIGTFGIHDGLPVDFGVAKAGWVAAARPILVSVAQRYQATITYKELATDIQTAAGVKTRMLITNWIGGVLGQVADECHARGEPLLPSLCVHADGTIGDGYAVAVAQTAGDNIGEHDIEMRAAEDRLRCYRHFGAMLPPDGGQPTLTPQVLAKRERMKRQSAPSPSPRVCPNCWMVLPMSGRCNNCASHG